MWFPMGRSRKKALAARCATGSLALSQPLTDNFNALRATIASMAPSGWTNVTMGAVWGAAMLSAHQPFAQTSSAPTVERNLLLLTDGDNTKGRFTGGPCGNWACVSAMDAKTAAACESAKQRGIKVYTVRVINGNANMLRTCASLNANGQPLYYEVNNAAELSQRVPCHRARYRRGPPDEVMLRQPLPWYRRCS